ncbi:MAG: GNAT family N-acetyltransferase [Candidatus Hydrogenedentes bacterium]|nr:GNAT family N-acetyltransferase [Candidatus Hydrogenedentota bacterium]
MSHIHVRQAAAGDVAVVSDMLKEATRWLETRGMPLWSVDGFAIAALAPQVAQGIFWLAEVEGTPAGCVSFQLEDPLHWPEVPAGDSAFLHKLAVRRAFAGTGVATALLDWAKRHARELGLRYVRLDTAVGREKLCALYTAQGFSKHSEKNVGAFDIVRFELTLET